MTYTPFGIGIEEEKRKDNDGVDRAIRFHYPLTPESIVIEIGGFRGQWTQDLINHLGFTPHIYVFEPVLEFFTQAESRLKANKNIHLYNFGLSDRNEQVKFRIDTDRTGIHSQHGPSEIVKLRDIYEVCKEFSLNEIDLCVSNCEGGEYTLLPRIIDSGLINHIKFLLVQFHAIVPECEAKRDKINLKLVKTHEHVFDYAFVWDQWRKK